jgi:hypothetical protein
VGSPRFASGGLSSVRLDPGLDLVGVGGSVGENRVDLRTGDVAHEGIPSVVIQRQHSHLGITSVYLQGIDSSEIVATVHSHPGPTISATAGLARQ